MRRRFSITWVLRGLALTSVVATGPGCARMADWMMDYSLGTRLPLGVRIDHIREGSPLPLRGYYALKPGTSDLGQALESMGAPMRVRRTPTEEVLEYYYLVGRRTRFILRPLFLFPYGSAAQLNARGLEDGLDVILLVFDHAGTLKRKEYRKSTPDQDAVGVANSVILQ